MPSCCGSWAWRDDPPVSVEGLIAHYGLLALFLGAGLEGETVVVAGGVLAHRGLVPLPGAMAAAAAGSFVADQLFFLGGRRFRDHRWIVRVRNKPAFARALALMERYPVGFIFAFRFIYGIRTVSPVALGTSRVPERTFLAINAVAAIVWGVVFTAIGYVFGRGFERLLGRLRPSHTTLLVGIGVVVAAVALWQAWRWWRARPA